MAEHDGWLWQGRQDHGYFGTGTKPKDDETVTLPAGDYYGPLAPLMNRILAVRPGDDVTELHREINAAFYAVGDMTGGHGTHKVLEDIVTGRVAGADRYQAAEELAIYARKTLH